MTTKACTKCKEVKTLDLFFNRKGATDGKMSSCKVCNTKKMTEWQKKNKERIAELSRARYVKKGRRLRTDEEIAESAKRRKESRSMREKSESVKAYRKEYKSRPDVVARVKDRSRTEENREKRRNYMRLRMSDPMFRLNNAVSSGIRATIRKHGARSFSILDYSFDEFVRHMERQFTKGMTWENFGRYGWHVDHIIPISAFKFSSKDDPEFKACWALSNLRPTWAKENLAKKDKIIFII